MSRNTSIANTQAAPSGAALSRLTPADLVMVQEAIAAHRQTAGGLLPLLHQIQDGLGHVPDDAVPMVAEVMNLSRAEVHGVLTFYHHFHREKPKGQVVQVCRAESCLACGSDALWKVAQTLGDEVTVEPVYCLGLCASSPAVQIGDRCHARMTPERLERLVFAQKETA